MLFRSNAHTEREREREGRVNHFGREAVLRPQRAALQSIGRFSSRRDSYICSLSNAQMACARLCLYASQTQQSHTYKHTHTARRRRADVGDSLCECVRAAERASQRLCDCRAGLAAKSCTNNDALLSLSPFLAHGGGGGGGSSSSSSDASQQWS